MNNIDLDKIQKYYDRVCLDANLMCDVYINPKRNYIEVTVFDNESDVLPTDEMLENADTISAETKYYSNDDIQSVILDSINELYDCLEGVNEMWTIDDSWSEEE